MNFLEPPNGPCLDCQRPAVHWFAEGGIMELNHGGGCMLCNRCVLRRQIANCEAAAARLPDLRVELRREEMGS